MLLTVTNHINSFARAYECLVTVSEYLTIRLLYFPSFGAIDAAGHQNVPASDLHEAEFNTNIRKKISFRVTGG